MLEWRWEQYPDEGSWICDYAVDGEADRGGIGTSWDDDDPEETLVRLADRLVEDSLSEVIWGGWPLCPRHPTRPMWPKNSDGGASWICEADPADRIQIGRSEPDERIEILPSGTELRQRSMSVQERGTTVISRSVRGSPGRGRR